MKTVDARCAKSVCYHDSCSSLREMGVRAEPRALLASVEGLATRELNDREVCCGFGGLFSVKYPEISERMADDKMADAVATGAEMLVGGDLGCLLHLAGRMKRQGLTLDVRHAAEILADENRMTLDPTAFREAAHEALDDARLKTALGRLKTHFALRRAEAVARYRRFRSVARSGQGDPRCVRSPISTRCWRNSSAT